MTPPSLQAVTQTTLTEVARAVVELCVEDNERPKEAWEKLAPEREALRNQLQEFHVPDNVRDFVVRFTLASMMAVARVAQTAHHATATTIKLADFHDAAAKAIARADILAVEEAADIADQIVEDIIRILRRDARVPRLARVEWEPTLGDLQQQITYRLTELIDHRDGPVELAHRVVDAFTAMVEAAGFAWPSHDEAAP